MILPNASSRDKDQSLGKGLFVRGKNKIKLESVTVTQWAGASAQILLAQLDWMDKDDIAKYLRFMGLMSD